MLLFNCKFWLSWGFFFVCVLVGLIFVFSWCRGGYLCWSFINVIVVVVDDICVVFGICGCVGVCFVGS